MPCYRCLLIVVVAASLAAPAQAGLFSKRPAAKGDPTEHVNELVVTARSAKEEQKRSQAVVELRQFDGAAYPQIAAVLIEVLRSDPSTSVRLEAAHSLAKLRPATEEAAQALETLLPELRARGYQFVTLQEYMNRVGARPAAATVKGQP